MAKVLGIDLGTTNTCAAVCDSQGPRVLQGRTGQSTMPSMVAHTEAGKRLVGHLAKRQAITNPAHTISGAKRLIGRRWSSEDVQKAHSMLPFDCKEGPHDDVRIQMGERDYAIAEIASMVLQEVRLAAEKNLGEPVSQAVITVPAYFNAAQRQATKDAGEIAGLDVLRIINEPTAAALAYGYGKDIEKRIAVYDLGGGTFDVSVVEISGGVFEVLSTLGDTFLGGEDFDDRIVDKLLSDFSREHGVDLRKDRMALQRLRDTAEKAKVELSEQKSVDINLPFIYTLEGKEALHLQSVLSREQLNATVKDLVDGTIKTCSEAMRRAEIDEVDGVLLVGGMTRMPLVQQEVAKFFGMQPSKGVHPDEVVACGAAVQAYELLYGQNETVLLDVTPHDLGIMVAQGGMETLIPKGTTVPTASEKVFTTTRDNQTQVRIAVSQGPSTPREGNVVLGECLLEGLPAAPKGTARVRVRFDISSEGLTSVVALDPQSGREKRLTVTASSGLDDLEKDAMAYELSADVVTMEDSERMQGVSPEMTKLETMVAEISLLTEHAREVLAETEFGRDALLKASSVLEEAERAIDHDESSNENIASLQMKLEKTGRFLQRVLDKLKR